MVKFASILSFVATVANAQELPYIRSCTEQDWVSIEDVGSNEALVTYSNSKESCSSQVTVTITAPNGISVNVTVEIGNAETVIVEPVDPQFMSIPPEAEIFDGEKQQFRIVGGIL